jgi:tetratricopeptide (TPR) repeat protein
MRWLHTEYLLKGVFLGLLVFAALEQPNSEKTLILAAFLAGGVGIGLISGLLSWLPRGIHVGGRYLALLLFLILENPILIYVGSIGGLLAGVLWVHDSSRGYSLLPICVGGGALVGLAIGEARRIGSANWRTSAAAAMACILVGVALTVLESDQSIYRMGGDAPTLRFEFGVHLLLGLPIFYLLTFAGRAEETEGEMAVLCAGLAISFWLMDPIPAVRSLALIIPGGIYAIYVYLILPGLRVFKHTLRGISYANMGRVRPALKAFRRALALDPNNKLAITGLARVHSGIDPRTIAGDAETIALLDLDLCLNRTARLLFQPSTSPAQLEEVKNLLDLIEAQRPERRAEIEYWRAVADMRAQRVDSAVDRLTKVLDPSVWTPEEGPSRSGVLFAAWQMALIRSSSLAARVGKPQLDLPGRRMEAIAATEQIVAENPQDADAWEMKRILYDGLTESQFHERPPVMTNEFDGGYVRELGMALLGDAARWQRGTELLRIAAQSMPEHAPSICTWMAQAYERAGDLDRARVCYQYIKKAGIAIGPANFPKEERDLFFSVIKKMFEDAAARNDHQEAIANLKLYAESEQSGIETYRQLAEMHERSGDALGALHYNDVALVYNANDRDLLARKDRYYYSVMPEQVKQLAESARAKLDFDYCIRKARQILSTRSIEADSIDWALHLIEFARVLRPDPLEPKILWARGMIWKGERDKALQLLEDIREAKPAKFSDASDEDAWYRCNQMLGDLYLNVYSRPDLAIPCYMEFRKSSKSGADTLFKVGQAYEAVGDLPKAMHYYESVTGYTEHPRYHEAREAFNRLKQSVGQG